MTHSLKTLLVALTAAVSLAAQATAQSSETGTGDGEVRRIDKAANKVTVRHGPIDGLDMPPMTMVLNVRDPALLERLKVGEKIRFTISREDGALYLQSLEPAK
jgi:Cu(I)/Ag(I) efflux system periplasmic protein CusF